jgi:hypothetical protein
MFTARSLTTFVHMYVLMGGAVESLKKVYYPNRITTDASWPHRELGTMVKRSQYQPVYSSSSLFVGFGERYHERR